MKPRTINIAIRRSERGGTFFTMLIFVMMLVSSALMYYYFQRTRSLERQIVSLQNGQPIDEADSSGFFGFLPWSADETDDSEPKKLINPPLPGNTDNLASKSEIPPAANQANLPPSGAASTPTPAPLNTTDSDSTNTEFMAQPGLNSETNLLPPAQAVAEPEISPTPRTNSIRIQYGHTESAPTEPAPDADGQSMYNMNQPPVRVRAPERQ